MIRTRTAIAAVIVAAELLVLAACSAAATTTPRLDHRGADDRRTTEAPTTSSTTTTSTTTSTPTTTAPPTTLEPTTTTTEPDVLRMPLTGVPISDPSEIPQRPAQAVKIDNVEPARPQSGLNEADIVFEEIINDGATRFAAVFHSQGVDTVGPVRSGRHPDIEILEAFDHPLFVWSGGNGGVTYYIERSELVDLSANHTSGYYRRSGRRRPWNLYTSSEAMWSHTPADFHVPPQVFKYLRPDEPIPNGQPATTINVTMDNIQIRWEYDSDTGPLLPLPGRRPAQHREQRPGDHQQPGADDVQLPAEPDRRPHPRRPDAGLQPGVRVHRWHRARRRRGCGSRPPIRTSSSTTSPISTRSGSSRVGRGSSSRGTSKAPISWS